MTQKWRLRKHFNSRGRRELYLVFYGNDRYNAGYMGYISNMSGKITAMYKDKHQIYSKEYAGNMTPGIKKDILAAFHSNYFKLNTDYISEDLNSSDDLTPCGLQ